MGWLGNIFIWLGLFLVGRKVRSAFLWTILGESIWVVYAAYWGWWDLSISCMVFVALSANNWYQWGKAPPAPLKEGEVLLFSGYLKAMQDISLVDSEGKLAR